jgi:AcrR family transcriptional regulator
MERHRIATTRPAGRPRSPEVHGAILDASIALIRDVGYDAVTMEGIAARAGVGKAALYRRWPSKEALVVEALGRLLATIPTPDTGTLAEDVRLVMRANLGMYADPASGLLLSGLVAAMARSKPIARAVREGFVAARHDALRTALARAVARGELRDDADLDLVVEMLNAPLFYRYLLSGRPVNETLVADVTASVLRAFAPAARTARPGTRRARRAAPDTR